MKEKATTARTESVKTFIIIMVRYRKGAEYIKYVTTSMPNVYFFSLTNVTITLQLHYNTLQYITLQLQSHYNTLQLHYNYITTHYNT